jgi:hypothetical protein
MDSMVPAEIRQPPCEREARGVAISSLSFVLTVVPEDHLMSQISCRAEKHECIRALHGDHLAYALRSDDDSVREPKRQSANRFAQHDARCER